MKINHYTLKIGPVFLSIMPNETILECAVKNGIEIKYHCASGYCGACKIKLIHGKVSLEHSGGISRSDIKNGYILTCCSFPNSDLEI